MSITITTLAGNKAVSDTVINVASTTGFAKRKVIQIDNEFFTQTADAVSGSTLIAVRSGDQGTYAQAHNNGAEVLVGDGNDFQVAPPGTQIVVPYAPPWNVITLVAAAAIPVPATHQNLYVELAGGSAITYTMVVPTSAQDGQEVIVQCTTAFAHIIQGAADPALMFNGIDQDKCTFGGNIGDYIHLKANAALATWMVLDSVHATLSDT